VLAHIHALVEALRAELDLRGYPGPRDALRLLDLFADQLVVRERDTSIPVLLLRPLARPILVLPRGLEEDERAAVVVEEIGHLLLDADLGAGRRWFDHGPLLAAQDARCEHYAGVFVRAWRLPRAVILGEPDEVVIGESGCGGEEVSRRRRDLAELDRS
jgi:hypothetical protein